MNIPSLFKSFSQLEILLLVIFILYIVLPIQTPDFLAGAINSSLGMLFIFIVTVYLFFHVNPIFAVVYIFVAYELLRRSGNKVGNVTLLQYTPTQAKKDAELKAMNPAKAETLEEQIVQKMAPIGHSDPSVFTSSSYKPIADNIKNASMY
jgi:predicted membrane protein